MPYRSFWISDYLASCIHVSLLMYAGRALGAQSQSLDQAFRILGGIMGTLFVSGIAFAFLRERRKRTAFGPTLAVVSAEAVIPKAET
jgi:membrane protein DedA with SNARE-associated domain